MRAAVIGIAEEFSIGSDKVHALGRAAGKVLARTLDCNFAIELALSILLATLVSLVDRDWYKIGFEFREDIFVCECRRTVDHAVVSCAAQRMSVHRPNEHGFL